jgi:hypothetical protein
VLALGGRRGCDGHPLMRKAVTADVREGAGQGPTR